MTERERLLRKISAVDFAIVELGIFLDTHPNDTYAIQKMDEYRKKSNNLIKNYEENFGQLISNPNTPPKNRWSWIANPWPWEPRKEN